MTLLEWRTQKLTAGNLESRYIHVLGYSTDALAFEFPRSINDDDEEEKEEEEAIGTLNFAACVVCLVTHVRFRCRIMCAN